MYPSPRIICKPLARLHTPGRVGGTPAPDAPSGGGTRQGGFCSESLQPYRVRNFCTETLFNVYAEVTHFCSRPIWSETVSVHAANSAHVHMNRYCAHPVRCARVEETNLWEETTLNPL